MGRRSIYIISILLLCILISIFLMPKGLKKAKTPDNLQNNNSEALPDNSLDSIHKSDQTNYDANNIQKEKPEEDASLREDTKLQEQKNMNNDDENKAADEAVTKEASAAEILSSIIINNTANPDKLKEQLSTYPAGTRVPTKDLSETAVNALFYYEELPPEVKERINGKSYGDTCDIPYSELRYVRVLYTGFDKAVYIGELIVNKEIAQDIADIFMELYKINYPIERMVLVDEYDADDNKSMATDNSSAFNYRFVDGTTHLSRHSEGRAIDINPLYNPYVRYFDGKEDVLPRNGAEYSDRNRDCEYYIRKDDPCYNAFIKRGFTWGGEWTRSKDYQHFQK